MRKKLVLILRTFEMKKSDKCLKVWILDVKYVRNVIEVLET